MTSGKAMHQAKKDERPQRGTWAPGGYLNVCLSCQDWFLGDKRAWDCADCAYKDEKDRDNA